MQTKNERRSAILRVLDAIAVGAAVFTIAYFCAWLNLRYVPNFCWQRLPVGWELYQLQEELDEYVSENGRPPAKLGDLKVGKEIGWNTPGQVLDPWGNPYEYTRQDGTPVVYSYGRDGRLGGVGLDSDLYSDGRTAEDSLPTFWQFSTELPSSGVIGTCLVAGMLASAVCLMLTRDTQLRKVKPAAIARRVTITVLASVVTAVLISFLHIPTGH